MANTTIQLRKSGVSGNIPSSLGVGELALNFADGKLFYKNNANIITFITSDILGVDLTQNNRLTSVETISTSQNTSISIIQGVDVTQNTTITAVNQFTQNAFNTANSKIDVGTALAFSIALG